MRPIIELAILEVCARRDWQAWAINVRLQHVHVVGCVSGKPGDALAAFKAFATRRLREDALVGLPPKVWARDGSTQYLRKDGSVAASVDYVMNRQGSLLAGSIFHSEMRRGPD